MKKSLSTKLIFLLLFSALLPLTLFGVISILTARHSAHKSITEGNMNVAVRAADQIELYVNNAINILYGLANNLNKTNFTTKQKNVVINNFVNNFPQFESIYILNSAGILETTSDLGVEIGELSKDPAYIETLKGDTYRSEVYISENYVPEMTIAVPIKVFNSVDGVVKARINLLDMWNLVDSIKIGKMGFAFVVGKNGILIAHGDEDSKVNVITQEKLTGLEIVKGTLEGKSLSDLNDNGHGTRMLTVSAPIKTLGWGVFIEQPTEEAYAPANRLRYQLVIMIFIFFVLIGFAGYFGGKRYVLTPISKIIAVTREIAKGTLDVKVDIKTGDEFSELGDSFNKMTKQLIVLQEDIKKKEREALIGKLAAGLIHDLKHPVGNIQMSAKLIQKMYDDEQYRKTFKEVVNRELSNINQFLERLRDFTSPKQMLFRSLEINKLIDEILSSMDGKIKEKAISLITNIYQGELLISGDKFALVNAFNNILVNGIQAIEEKRNRSKREEIHTDMSIKVKTCPDASEKNVFVTIEDSGMGIPSDKIKGIFDDFATTKKKGLGLGLAMTRRTIDQHNGEIKVESLWGEWTSFTIILPKVT